MKSGRTLVDLAAEITRQAEAKRDFIAPTEKLKMVTAAPAPGSAVSIQIPSDKSGAVLDLPATDYAHGQIAERLGIPVKHYRRLQTEMPDVLANEVNAFWERQPARSMVRTLDGRVRGVLSDRYRLLDNYQVLNAGLEALQSVGEMVPQSMEVTEQKLYLKATFPMVRAEVKLGDVVEAGIVLSNSEIGAGAARVEPMVFRLVCLNGMIAGKGLAQYHVGKARGGDFDGEINYETDTLMAQNHAFLLALRDAIRTSVSHKGFEKVVGRLKIAAGLEIAAPVSEVVELTAQKFNLATTEREGVLEHLLRGGDLSQWGLVNAVTRASQDVPDYDRATELEAVGGKIIELGPADWVGIAHAHLGTAARRHKADDVLAALAKAA